jgi:hypothetical protein
MKITIELDDAETLVFQNITDYYIAVRQLEPYSDSKGLYSLPETKSFSRGGNVRELVKELSQSLIELQDFLKANCDLNT